MNSQELIQLPIPVVLASASPRRKELLAQLLPSFEVVVSGVDEEALTVADPWETAQKISRAKAVAVAGLRPGALIIGADTVVAFEGPSGWEQLAKPTDKADAVRMLQSLSNRTHVVITGVTIYHPHMEVLFTDTTTVTFRPLTIEEIKDYVATGEPMDKAGAYAIQGGAAGFATKIEGSMTNVIGLPLEELGPCLAGPWP